MAKAFLAFGSNLGARVENLKRAQDFLVEGGVRFVMFSSIFETEPFLHTHEEPNPPWYLNQVTEVETDLPPPELFALGKEIESRMGGKTPTALVNGVPRYFSRLIDVDLLFYEDLVMETPSLTLPHPRFHRRLYDLVPLAEIAPALVHPVFEKTIAELLESCEDKSKVCYLKNFKNCRSG